MNHLSYIDEIKGFAIILVVMGHLIGMCLYYEQSVALQSPILTWIDFFHMPLFAFVSGYLFKTPITPMQLFQKSVRVLIPFVVVGLLNAIFCGIKNITAFFLSSYKYGYWYLWAMAIFYLLMPLLSVDWLKSKKIRIIAETLLLFLLYFSINFSLSYIDIDTFNFLSADMLMSILPFFGIGMLIRRYDCFEILFSSKWIVAISAIFYFVLFICYTGNGGKIIIAKISAIFFYVCLFYRLRDIKHWSKSILGYMGRNSLYIYIFHYFIIHYLRLGIWGEFLIERGGSAFYILEFALAFVCALTISTICALIAKGLSYTRVTRFLINGKI